MNQSRDVTNFRSWEDSSLTNEERVSALMAEMTLEEKVGQLGSIWLGFNAISEDVASTDADNVPVIVEVSQQLSWEDSIRHGLGHFTRVFGTKPIQVGDGIKRVIELQRKLMSETRLGIPATVHEECLTGFTTMGATTFPTPLGLALRKKDSMAEYYKERYDSFLSSGLVMIIFFLVYLLYNST